MDDYNVGLNGEEEEVHSQLEEEEFDDDDDGLFEDDFHEDEYQDVDADASRDDDPLRTAEGLQRESYHETDVRFMPIQRGEGSERLRAGPSSAEEGGIPRAEGSGSPARAGGRAEEFVPAQPSEADMQGTFVQAGGDGPRGSSLKV